MIIYQEKVPTYPLITAIVGITVLIFLILAIAPFFGKFLQITPTVQFILIFVILLDAIALISFNKLTIILTDTHFSFGFGKFSKKVALKDIVNVQPGEYKFSNYLGYGIRVGRDNTIGYTPRGGKGIIVTIKDDRHGYFISTANPESLCSAIKQKIK